MFTKKTRHAGKKTAMFFLFYYLIILFKAQSDLC